MKKGKNILLFLLVVIFIVGSAGVGYYMGASNQSDVIKKADNNEDNKMSDETIDKLGKKLFYETSGQYTKMSYFFYGSDKLTVDKVDLEGKLISTMNNIGFNDIYYNQINDLFSQECQKESDDSNGFNYTFYVYKVNKDIFAEVYYNLFNQNMPTFNYFIYLDSLDNRVCKLEDNEIKCYPMDSGSDIGPGMKLVNYDRAEFDNGNLYVYSDFIAFDLENNTDNYYVYSDYNCTKKIAKVDYDEFETYEKKDIFTKFKDKTGKYKLTFKQRENGTWYWESTEVVK